MFRIYFLNNYNKFQWKMKEFSFRVDEIRETPTEIYEMNKI